MPFRSFTSQPAAGQRDAQPFRLESQVTADSKGKDGKSAVWRASFASPAGPARETLCVVGHGCARMLPRAESLPATRTATVPRTRPLRFSTSAF